jgi:hypothetical protein
MQYMRLLAGVLAVESAFPDSELPDHYVPLWADLPPALGGVVGLGFGNRDS